MTAVLSGSCPIHCGAPIIRQFKIFEELGSWFKSEDRLGSIWLTLYDKESGDFSSDGVAYLRFLPLDSLSPDV